MLFVSTKEVPVGLEDSPPPNVIPQTQTVSNKNLLNPAAQMVPDPTSGKGTRLEPGQCDDVKDAKGMDGNWPTHPCAPTPNGKGSESPVQWD